MTEHLKDGQEFSAGLEERRHQQREESLSLRFLQSSWVHKIHTKEKTNHTGGIDN